VVDIFAFRFLDIPTHNRIKKGVVEEYRQVSNNSSLICAIMAQFHVFSNTASTIDYDSCLVTKY
jgi:hypothetical protein